VIVVWGSLDDPPIARILDLVDDGATDLVHLDDGALAGLGYDVEIGPALSGWVELGGAPRTELTQVRALYLRPGRQQGAGAAGATAAAMLLAIADSLPATVVNRPSAGRSNHSKPYQGTVLAALGLPSPDTLVTSDRGAAREFLVRHGRIVYKSISGVRSVVTAIDADGRATDADSADRLDEIGHGPVQLQQWIDGLDVRAHVVTETVFATAVESDAIDYRYGASQGQVPTLTAHHLSERLGEHLVAVTRRMGLLVAGIDLRQTPTGDWYCFEVNPSPGFTFYEDHTGQPIAAAIAALLRGR
jgi:glutathione synthase/RimK-type ligase-like ATP-grasp enzyme